MNGRQMAVEMGEQPRMLESILREGRREIASVAGWARRRNPRFVLFAARGSSDHAALYAKYLVETSLSLPAGLMSPSALTVYDADLDFRDMLVIGVSQSGASPDLLECIGRARSAGAATIAVTNVPDSPLATEAEAQVHIRAGPERAIAATKTYTAQLLSLYLLIEVMANRSTSCEYLPERAAEILSDEGDVERLAQRLMGSSHLVTTARGFNFATALESALKLMETSYLVAHGFSAADLLHGPLAMIGAGFPVIAFSGGGRGGAALIPVLRRLAESGARTVVVGGDEAADHGTDALRLHDLGPEALTPILLALPAQQLAWYVARLRGLDPDRPRGLAKVTQSW